MKLIKLLTAIFFAYNTFATSNIISELSPSEIKQIENHELVIHQKEINDSPVPEVTIFALINSTPLEAMGIFSALDYQEKYVPNILKSKPVKNISSIEVHTEYEMHAPFPLSNIYYTHGSVVHQYQNDYELTWYMVTSTSTDQVNGSAYFTLYNGKTLFKYKSFIKPKSILATLIKSIIVNDMTKTVDAIRDHIEKLKRENSPLISKYSDYISRAIKGEFVYKTNQ